MSPVAGGIVPTTAMPHLAPPAIVRVATVRQRCPTRMSPAVRGCGATAIGVTRIQAKPPSTLVMPGNVVGDVNFIAAVDAVEMGAAAPDVGWMSPKTISMVPMELL